MTVSIESAIKSRLCSEYRIPFVPMLIASLTPTVLNWYPTNPACCTPSRTRLFRSSRCMLHGLPLYQTDEIPTCPLFKSSSWSPVAYSIACEAPCEMGCVTWRETLLIAESASAGNLFARGE